MFSRPVVVVVVVVRYWDGRDGRKEEELKDGKYDLQGNMYQGVQYM